MIRDLPEAEQPAVMSAIQQVVMEDLYMPCRDLYL